MTDPIKTPPTSETVPATAPETKDAVPVVKDSVPETITPKAEPSKQDAAPKKVEKAPIKDTPVVREKIIEKVIVQPQTEPQLASNSGAWPIIGVLVLTLAFSYAIQRLNHHPAFSPIRRWLPVVQIAIWCVAVLVLGALTIQHLPIEWFYFELVLLVLLVLINQTWLRSVLSGAALTLEGKFQKGDTIRVDALEGEILSFGLRAVRLRATDGTLHDIPNHELTSNAIANLSGDGGDSACEVIVTVPENLSLSQAMSLAIEAAMLSPLASPRHKPEVFMHNQNQTPHQIKVRGYAFDPNFQDHFRSDVTARILTKYEYAIDNRPL